MAYNREIPRWTAHGRHRAKNRAFRPETIRAILEHGRILHAGGHCTAYFLGQREVAAARRRGIRLDPFVNRAVVIAADGRVVTVAHVRRLPRHWRSR
jgi:hypothetical protein